MPAPAVSDEELPQPDNGASRFRPRTVADSQSAVAGVGSRHVDTSAPEQRPVQLQPDRGAVSYRFDKYELFPEAEQLRKKGMQIQLGPKPFRLLLLLVSRAGSIVTREEIQKELWGDATFVDFEQGINAVIRRIRFALNDQAETPRFLQTLPRRGYCFLMPVERIDPVDAATAIESFPTPDPPPPVQAGKQSHTYRRRVALVLLCAAASLFPTRSAHEGPAPKPNPSALRIVVAPATRDGAPSGVDPNELAAELRRSLARLPPDKMSVVAPGRPADLRIDTITRGTQDGPSVDARLTELSSGKIVWAETLHRTGDAKDFPLEVAVRVTRNVLHLYVPRPTREVAVRSRVSPRALALYREGRAVRDRPIPQADYKRAVELFEQATALEPDFAEAWTALGDIWTTRTVVWKEESRRMAIEEARRTLDRALVADPRSADALNNRAVLLMTFDRSYTGAEASLRAAVAADPAYFDARVNLALLLSAMGRHEEALSEMQRAQSIDPAALFPNPALAFLYLMARRYGDAHAEYRTLLASHRQPTVANWGMTSAAISAGRWNDAARSLSAVIGQRIEIPPDSPDPRLELRKYIRTLDERDPALQWTRLDAYTLAALHAQTGDKNLAFAALDRAAALQMTDTMFAYVDPRLDSIRQDPRFVDYLVRFGLIR
jgi:DNA-binding winged helix-turn-helix (wHTH) protein/tetratricopeptide (TPR) repeat protein